MKLFDIFKKKKEKTILEKSLEEVAKVGNNQPVKGVETVDEHYKKHPFNKKIMKKVLDFIVVLCLNLYGNE